VCEGSGVVNIHKKRHLPQDGVVGVGTAAGRGGGAGGYLQVTTPAAGSKRKLPELEWNPHHVIHMIMTLTLFALGYDCLFIKFQKYIFLSTLHTKLS
jgi:hypothetical protein